MKRFLDASRVLIASSVVLAAALAFLLYQRFKAPPPRPPAPPPAAVVVEARAEPPRPPAEPAHAAAEAHAEPPKPDEARPTEAPAHAAAEPPKPDEAKPTEAPAAAPPAKPDAAAAEPRSKAKPRPRQQGAAPLADDAAAAIFGDRPAPDGDGSRQKTPRIPVLRKPPAGVAPAAYAAALPRPGASPPSSGGARPPAAPRPTAAAPAPAAAPGLAAAPAPAPGPAPSPPQARPSPGGQPLPGAVSGTLRGAAGAPIAGTTVLAVSAAGDDAFETVSDDDGFYLLSGLKSGRYLLFTGLGARPAAALPARAVEIQGGRVVRLDLREPGAGTTVRVRPLLADGRPLAGQALLVAGAPPGAAALPALLRSDAVFLPEAGAPTLLRRVPAGVYTLVVLQADATLRVAKQPVAVRGDGEQVLEVRFPADLAAAPAP